MVELWYLVVDYVATASGGRIKLRWRDGGKAPRWMWGEISAVSVAYFRPLGSKGRDNEVFTHTFAKNQWSELPKCPNSDFSLAIINSLLTGETPTNEVTNSLLSLTDNKWTKQFPPKPTKRWSTVVVCSGKTLVVIGSKCNSSVPV